MLREVACPKAASTLALPCIRECTADTDAGVFPVMNELAKAINTQGIVTSAWNGSWNIANCQAGLWR